MPEFTFETNLYATITVSAGNEERARKALPHALEHLNFDGSVLDGINSVLLLEGGIMISEASIGQESTELIEEVGTDGAANVENPEPQQGQSLTARITIALETISDVVCTAFEGGCDHWIDEIECVEPTGPVFRSDEEWPRYATYPVSEGGAVLIHCDGEVYRLDLSALQRGLDLLEEKSPKHFDWLIQENHDADTADILVQLACFGEIVYG